MNKEDRNTAPRVADGWLIPLLLKNEILSSRQLKQLLAPLEQEPVFLQNLLLARGILTAEQLYRLVWRRLGICGRNPSVCQPDIEQIFALGANRLQAWQILTLIGQTPPLNVVAALPLTGEQERWLEWRCGMEVRWMFGVQREVAHTWRRLSQALGWLRDYLNAQGALPSEGSNLVDSFVRLLLARVAERRGLLHAFYLPGNAVRLELETEHWEKEHFAVPSILWPSLLRQLFKLGGCRWEMVEEKNNATLVLPAHQAEFGARLRWKKNAHRFELSLQWVEHLQEGKETPRPAEHPNFKYIPELLRKNNGLVLLSGRLESPVRGRLNLELEMLKMEGKRLLIIERQVSPWIPGVVKLRWQTGHEPGPGALLRSFLSLEPEVVVLEPAGEKAAIALAVQEARRRLVVLVLEKPTVFSALEHLQQKVAPQDLAAVFSAAVAVQKLPALCTRCRPVALPRAGLVPTGGAELSGGAVGCPACGFTGYAGWVLIQEFLPASPELRKALHQQASVEDIVNGSAHRISFQENAWALIRRGVTDWQAVQQLFGQLGISPSDVSPTSLSPARTAQVLAGSVK